MAALQVQAHSAQLQCEQHKQMPMAPSEPGEAFEVRLESRLVADKLYNASRLALEHRAVALQDASTEELRDRMYMAEALAEARKVHTCVPAAANVTRF